MNHRLYIRLHIRLHRDCITLHGRRCSVAVFMTLVYLHMCSFSSIPDRETEMREQSRTKMSVLYEVRNWEQTRLKHIKVSLLKKLIFSCCFIIARYLKGHKRMFKLHSSDWLQWHVYVPFLTLIWFRNWSSSLCSRQLYCKVPYYSSLSIFVHSSATYLSWSEFVVDLEPFPGTLYTPA